MRVFIIGSKELGCLILEETLSQGHEVIGVFSRDHEPGMKVWHELGHRSLHDLAAEHNIPVHQGIRVNSDASLELLSALKPDLILSCFWSEILREPVLNIPKLGVYNFHTAYLPKNRGSRPIPWALIKGELHTGMTLHRMHPGVDNGPIVDQEKVLINETDTASTLYEKVISAGHLLVKRNLERFANNSFPLTPQDELEATYHPRGEPYGGQINAFWNDDQKKRFLRAFHFPPFRAHRDAPEACINKTTPEVYWVMDKTLAWFDLPESDRPWTRNDIGNSEERKQLKKHFAGATGSGIIISESIADMFPIHDVLAGLGVTFTASNRLSPSEFFEHPEHSQPFRYENGLLEIPILDMSCGADSEVLQQQAEQLSKTAERDIFVPIIAKNFIAPTGRTLTFSEVHDHFNTPYHDTSA